MNRRAADLLLGARLTLAGGRAGVVRTATTAVAVALGVAALLIAASIPSMYDSRRARGEARRDVEYAAPAPSARSGGTVLVADAMEHLLVTTAELAHEGNVLPSGMPKPLHLALFVERFQREVRAPFPPAWMVRVLMAPLAALARRRGHDARYGPELALA